MTFGAIRLFWVCLLLSLPAFAAEPVQSQQGVVSWVYDGDTLEIDRFGKVRLIGIDVPERESSTRDAFLTQRGIPPAGQRQAYRAAKDFSIKAVKGQKVTLAFDESPRDRHGRLLAYVYLPDGRLLNRVLIEQGMAVVYRRFSFTMKQEFLAAEDEAKRLGVGLWGDGTR